MNQSEYISHNLNAHDDDKIVALIETHTAAGYGVYWVIVERMGKEDAVRLADKKHTHIMLARKCNVSVETVKAVIDTCMEFELFQREDTDYFFSQSLRDRMKLREEAYEKKRRAGKSGADKRWHHDGTATQTDSSAIENNGSAMGADSTLCQIEKEKLEGEVKIEIRSEKGESESPPAPAGDAASKKNEEAQAQAALKFKPPKNPIPNPGAGAKKTTAHLFKDSPYNDLESFKAAPLFNTDAFRTNYPHIDLEYYFTQLARYATGEAQYKKSDWLVYVQGWMSEDKTNNKLRTVKRNGNFNHRSSAVSTSTTSLSDTVRAQRAQERAGAPG